MRKCKNCGLEKNLNEYHVDKKKDKLYYRSNCKQCRNLMINNYRLKNIESYNERRTIIRNKSENRIKHRERNLLYYKNNKNERINYQTKYFIKKYNNDINFKLKKLLTNRLRKCLKHQNVKKNNITELLGCDIDFFKEHLENQFTNNMSWNNRNEWHLDHIIPCFYFDLTKEEEQKRCFHYLNIRPLYAKENLNRNDYDFFIENYENNPNFLNEYHENSHKR